MAVVTPTRRPWRGRLLARVRAVYLRWLIKHAEKDLKRQRAEFEHASMHWPKQIKHSADYIHALTKQLQRALNDT